MDLEVLQMSLDLLEQNYKNLVEVTNDRNKKFDNDLKKMMSVNKELEIKVENLNYNLKEKKEKFDEISNQNDEKQKKIENLIYELEEQKTSYQVYKDQNELKIKENKEKIDEISNQNEEKQKRIENLINESKDKTNLHKSFRDKTEKKIKNRNTIIQRLKDDLRKSKSNYLKKEKNYSELVSKQKIENDRARNIITKVLSTDSGFKKNIVSEVEVIPNSQLNTVQSNALIDSYNQMLKRAYLLLERSRNI